jgi:hypothetical protein
MLNEAKDGHAVFASGPFFETKLNSPNPTIRGDGEGRHSDGLRDQTAVGDALQRAAPMGHAAV